MDLTRELVCAKNAAIEAGKILLAHYNNPSGIERKDDQSLVSDADKASSKQIQELLVRDFPDYDYIDEERTIQERKNPYCWVVDPLDGTREYLEKKPDFGILIGLMKEDVPVAGVAYRPLTGEMMYASYGRGAYREQGGQKEKISVSLSKEISALISTSRHNLELDSLLSAIKPHLISKMGSAFKLAEIAAGRATLYLAPKQNTMHLWDICAFNIILQEAGGIITDLEGFSLDFSNPHVAFEKGIVAAPITLHTTIIDNIRNFLFPLVVIVCGLLGTGKTTLSKRILQHTSKFIRFNTDETRKLLGKTTFDRKDTPEVNAYMYTKARDLLNQKKSVLFDSTYKLQEAREKIYNLAKEFSVPVILIECISSDDTTIRRLTARPGRDGKIYDSTNKEEDYYEYVRLWEDTSNDIEKYPFVSLIKVNTEDYSLKVVKQQGVSDLQFQEIINLAEKALVDMRSGILV